MPSLSLQHWRTERMRNLQEIDGQCAAALALAPPNAHLSEENLRGYILLLSAHFQGFCRDLYAECAQVVVGTMPPVLHPMIQMQTTAGLALDRGNPNRDNIRKDFERFGAPLNWVVADPANHGRLRDLERLNGWRNVAAHYNVVPPGGLPSHTDMQNWWDSCEGIANFLDGFMYYRLQAALGIAPWAP